MCGMLLLEFISKEHGAAVRLAHAIGAYEPDVRRWANGQRSTPVHHCVAIEQATGGQVTRRDLRPDDWCLIWPELAEKKDAA